MPTYGTKQFRTQMKKIVNEMVNRNQETLVYNDQYPQNSFYAVPIEEYHNLLKIAHKAAKANSLEKVIEEKDKARSNRFRKMVEKRYGKKSI